MTELERLQKEINGKEVKWVGYQWGVKMDAICIWPPNGTTMSVKPYGHEPDDIFTMLNGDYSLSEIKSPTFCLSAADNIHEMNDEEVDVLRRVAEMHEGDVYDIRELLGNVVGGGDPSCPYG